jgi:hypothetical protein
METAFTLAPVEANVLTVEARTGDTAAVAAAVAAVCRN